MRRGMHESQWGNGQENWVSHNPRFPRGNRRPNVHRFNNRTSGPRHWRPDGNFRPRVPIWNSSFPPPQQFPPPLEQHLPPHPHTQPPNSRFNWTPHTNHPNRQIHPLISTPPAPLGLPGDHNLHDTINTVKQKLRERKVSETNTEFVNDAFTDQNCDQQLLKPSEKRRIEHSKMPAKIISKKSDRKEGGYSKLKNDNTQQLPANSSYHRKSEIMRRKILQQLFKMDKDTLRQILNHPATSAKYDFALNSLIKETRNSISHQLRNAAEKSLRYHKTNADSLHGQQIVQDAFMGHLGKMLDTDASVELFSMEPQVIAELSKVLQEDLMGMSNEDMSVRSLANVMQENTTEDYCNLTGYSKLNESNSQMYYNDENNFNTPYYSTNLGLANNTDVSTLSNCYNQDSSRNHYLSNYDETNCDSSYKNNFYTNESEVSSRENINTSPISEIEQSNIFDMRECESPKESSVQSIEISSESGREISNKSFISSKHAKRKNPSALTESKQNEDAFSDSYNFLPDYKIESTLNTKQSLIKDPVYKCKDNDSICKNIVSPRSEDSIKNNIEDDKHKISLDNNIPSVDDLQSVKESSSKPKVSEDLTDDSCKMYKMPKVRKRKISETSLHDSSQKIPAVPDFNISVRKDIFSPESKSYMNPQNDSVSVESKKPSISFINVCCQTDSFQNNVKSQSTQYHFKKCDASSQVYESLIGSKSKGTQTTRHNIRDKSCQTLTIEGLSMISVHPTNDNNCSDKETQTDDVAIVNNEKTANTLEKPEKDVTACVKSTKPLDRTSKQEDILDRMRQLDSQILLLMQEKLNLYNLLDLPNNLSNKINDKAVPSPTNQKFKNFNKLSFHKLKVENSRMNFQNTSTEKLNVKRQENSNLTRSLRAKDKSVSRDDNVQTNQHNRQSSSAEHKLKDSQNKHKNNASDHSSRSRKTSSSISKTKSKHKVNDEGHIKSECHKNSAKKIKCDNNEIGAKVNSTFNVVPGKDINNSKCSDSSKDNVSICTDDMSNEYNNFDNIDITSDIKYFDSTGCPVSLDCNLVVSEEVVITENDNNNQKDLNIPERTDQSVATKKRRSERKYVGRSKSNDTKVNNSDCDKSDNSLPIPHSVSVVPPLRIRKKHITNNSAEAESKASPLFNLISQLDDSDDECDINISMEKPKSIMSEDNERLNLKDETDSQSSSGIKIMDCRVHLERLDANKIPSIKSSIDSGSVCDSNDNALSILNDETLFTSKDYENDDDCISLEQLETVQFDDFCDPDVPSIINNIEVNDSFNIMDQWDSKLFENVTLLEDREMFNTDKTLLDSIVTSNDRTQEAPVNEPITFKSHKDSIIAIKCVDKNFLASSLDGNVYYYSTTNGKLLQTLHVSHLAVTCLSIKLNKKQTHVYTGSLDSTLRCFDFETGEKTMEDINIGGPIQSMYQEWKTLFIGTQTGFVIQFNIESDTVMEDKTLKFADNSILALQAIKEGPRKVLLIASRSQEVTVKDINTGLLLRSFHGPNNTVYSLLFDMGKVYCGTSGVDVQIFDFVSGKLTGYHKGGRGAVCLQMYKGLLFTGCYDGIIYVFKRCKSETPVARITGPGKMLLAMAIFDNKIIAGCKDKSLSIIPLPKEVIHLLDS